jgi:NADH-quinone oxidoreductase subunit L
VLNGGFRVPFVMLALTSLLTAFYMFRAVFLVFFGRTHGHAEGHGVPLAMDGVCRLLAAVTVAYGLVLAFGGDHGEAPAWLPWVSMLLAAAGIGLAWATYQREVIPASRLSSALAPIDFMARRRYGLDAVYAGLYRIVLLGVSRAIGWIDRYLVDGVLNVLSAAALRAGDALRHIQTGQPQDYVYGVAVGVLLLLVWAHLVIP